MPAQEDIARLTQVRERTLAKIDQLREELQTEIEPASSATDDAGSDVATAIYERGMSISLIRNLESKLHSLDRALEMAAKGRYGICEKCGVQIPHERLDILPETTICVRCASEREAGLTRGGAHPRRRP